MNTTDLDVALDGLALLSAQRGSPEDELRPELDGRMLRQLFEHGTALLGGLRRALSTTQDPRLALELAAAAQQLSHEATRMSLVAADRLSATNADELHEDELNLLRGAPADTSRMAWRSSGRSCFKNPAELLASWLKIRYPQANRMIQDAADLIGRRDPAGMPLPPRFGHLGQLFQDPQANPETVRETSNKLARREPADSSFEGITSEATLIHADGKPVEEHAAQILRDELTPSEAGKKISGLIELASSNPSTSTPTALRRGLFRRYSNNPAVIEYLLRVSTLEAERIESLIAQANNPKTDAGQRVRRNTDAGSCQDALLQNPLFDSTELPDFLPPEAAGARWEPETAELQASPPERALNALLELLSTSDEHSGVKKIHPEVVVHMKVENLQELARANATTAHGIHLPPDQLRALLCEAKIIPAVFNGRGELLDYGVGARLVPPKLRKAVLARDRGCLVPGCTVAPERVEVHHIKPYSQGGTTSLDNLGPGCDSHHTAFDLGIIKMIFKDGRPWVILPKHIDPEQKPRRNTYWDEYS